MRSYLINLFFWKTDVMKSSLICLSTSDLAQKMADHLNFPLFDVGLSYYPDGEIRFLFTDWHIFEQQSVTIIHSTGYPVQDNLVALVVLADLLKKHNARVARAIIPYFGYARQNQKIDHQPGVVQSIIAFLELLPIDEFMVVELHDPSIITLFNKPIVNITLEHLLAKMIQQSIVSGDDYCIVAPDQGAAHRAQSVAQLTGLNLVACEKQRLTDRIVVNCSAPNQKKKALIVDDMISTGATVTEVVEQLKALGISRGWGIFVHPVFAQDSFDKIVENSFFEKIIVSNTLPLPKKHHKVVVLDCSPALLTEL
jgi:ribose-phosphate pyrophosphokinase